MTTTLQCAHSPIAQWPRHIVVCHNYPLPSSIVFQQLKFFNNHTGIVSLVCYLTPSSISKAIHPFQFHVSPHLSKSNYYVPCWLNISWTSKAPPSLHNPYANNLGVANPETLYKDVPTSNICIRIIIILLHKIWRLVDHILLVIEPPNLSPSTLLPSHLLQSTQST